MRLYLIYNQVTASHILPDSILDERAREFAGENIRWFDVKLPSRTLLP